MDESNSSYVNDLLKALDNENNQDIIHLNKQKIQTIKNDILQKLQLSRDNLKNFHKKLKQYRYVTDLVDLKEGTFIRWIKLTNPDTIYLTNGGIVVNTRITNKGINIVCKNNYNRMFQIKFDECLIFQKLTNQELVILDVMEHLEKDR